MFHKKVVESIKQCQLIINKNQTKYLAQKKTQAPTLKAQIKLHKTESPIRPVVNNIKAPTYKLAKFLAKNITSYLNLQHQYNAKNSTERAHDLKNITIRDEY
jgi:thermostable 8-oxoguanine DNA glycosylase